MPLPHDRPEDRQRRADPPPAWVDTVPTWFRSEAFAEDLPETPPGAARAAPAPRAVQAPLRHMLPLGWRLAAR